MMVPSRVQNPAAKGLLDVERRLRAGEAIVIQFSDPGYTPEVLQRVDALCAEFGERLEVRFYGHYSAAFDCRTLEKLRAVANLSIDCLQRVENMEAVAQLGSLRRLSVGIFELADDEILRFPNLRSLRSLRIDATRTKAVDLSFLGAFLNLEYLMISGHTRGLTAVKGLPSLTSLGLASIGKRTRLDFVADIPQLRRLILSLGGRSSIAELEAPHLEELQVIRVLGLADLGDLSRFSELKSFAIEDQVRVERLLFSRGDSKLATLRIVNCKSLRDVTGLEALSRLEHLRISRTALDPEALLARRLPPRLQIFAIYTGKERENRRLRQILDARGYLEYSDAPGAV